MSAQAGNRASGPRFRTPFGFLAAFRKDPLGILTSWWRDYGDTVEIRYGIGKTFLVVHPEGVRHILHETAVLHFDDPRQAANTGMELIESMCRWDLQGDIVYENRPEGGARVVVTFGDPE